MSSRSVAVVAAQLRRGCDAASSTESRRKVRREYSRRVRDWDRDEILRLVKSLHRAGSHQWVGYEILANHPTFETLKSRDLEQLGRGLENWWTVDAFARTVSGPAWLRGQIDDRTVHIWAGRDSPWWRRIALVSTVALNVRSHGGRGDRRRTLRVCSLLIDDHRDMVVKAMSWALRELVVHDPDAVAGFVDANAAKLASRVRREVANKLATGRKNPK